MSKGLLSTILIILGVFLAIFGFYTSFEIYVKDKLGKSSENIGYFLIKVMQGETLINTPDKLNTILTLKTPEGKVYATQNINLPVDKETYYHFQKIVDNHGFNLYVKSTSIFEYIEYIVNNPMAIGISLSGIFLILIGIYTAISSQTTKHIPQEKETITTVEKTQPYEYEDELIKRLKALRITLATSKIIPEESLEEAKSIIDSILHNISRGGKV